MKIDGIIAQSLRSLDQASWLRLRIFGRKLLLVIVFAVAFAASRSYPLAGALALFCGWNFVFAALLALFERQGLDPNSLTVWDETAAFLGLAALMRLVGAITS
ncbi:MAG TPA: hypothetical protein VN808_17935 [Stellaceae bacterium]|nr:hypothetical protein [Stellaceae bacterium]